MILVLEVSTSSAKAMVYCPHDGVKRVSTRPYKQDNSDVATQDAAQMMDTVLGLGREMAEGYPITVVTLCGTWHSLLLCDRSGEPASPVYSWADLSATPTVAGLRRDRALADGLYRSTGCVPHAMYPLYKLVHMRGLGQKLHDKLAFCQGSYLFWLLTGERITSDCIVSGSSLLNIHSREYDIEALALTGMGLEQFPRLSTYRTPQRLSRKGAKLLGLKAGIPVVPPYPDGGLNQVGAGALKPGVMTLSIGTSGALRIIAERPVFASNRSTWCYLSPDSWLSGAATAAATSCVDWLMQKVLGGSHTYRQIEDQIVPRTDMPFFMPFLSGERCPGWNGERRAIFASVDAGHEGTDLYFAVLEGVLFNLLQCYRELVALNGKPRLIRVSGGVCKSRLWLQMLADMWEEDIAVADVSQASLLGAAAVGMYVDGHLPSLEAFTQEDKTIRANPDMADFYRSRFARWLKIYHENNEGGYEQT